MSKSIKLEHIKPGAPTQNAYVERFNRHFREYDMYAYIFGSLSQLFLFVRNGRVIVTLIIHINL